MPTFFHKKHPGTALLYVLIFGSIATTVIISGLASYGLFEHKATLRNEQSNIAFHIAESGINYYRWHLAHNPNDFTDGTASTSTGPFVHAYYDKDGNQVGWYSLEIDPPTLNTTIVTLRSTGWTIAQPNSKRTIQVRLGYDSMTDYTFLTNANMNFGMTTEVHGVVHSNGGIRFDGTTDSWVYSAKETYQYLNQTHNGIWGGGEPKSFWKYPVPAVDFTGITSDLSTIRANSDQGGIHLLSSGVQGWRIVFKADGTFDLYKVQTLNCYNGEGKYKGHTWYGNVYCYDIKTQTFVQNYALPANGIIFVEDYVWVEGVLDGHVTVAAARFPVQPSNYRNIYISGNLTYETVASNDSLGLLVQGDIIVPHDVPEDMHIHAALLSQYGGIYRPYYDDDERDSLTVFGSQISYEGGGWKYTNGWGNVISGFVDTNHTYDANLAYYPPPGFPTGNTYSVISWEEIQ